MYKVKLIAIKEVVEVEVEATYCLVDAHNNLCFNNVPYVTLDPIAMFPSNRWFSTQKVAVRRTVSSTGGGIPLRP